MYDVCKFFQIAERRIGEYAEAMPLSEIYILFPHGVDKTME